MCSARPAITLGRSIGRALMGRHQLMLLDEPSLGLAPLLVKVGGYHGIRYEISSCGADHAASHNPIY